MPSSPLTFTTTADPVEAKAWFAGLVEREPVALSVIASVADSLVADPTRFVDPRWWGGREGGPEGPVVAAFMHTPPHPVHVARATPEQAQQLARVLVGVQHETVGVGGDRECATAFAQAWVAARGGRAVTRMELGVFELPGAAVLPFEVPGGARLARPDDVDLVNGWMAAFAVEVEAGHGGRPAGRATDLDPAVRGGRVLLWEHDGRPVSMAYTSAPNGGVVRVSGVWTPVEHRRHGYASAVVFELSRRQSGSGHRCMLYTDLANPTSNAIYRAIGYHRIGDQVTIDFR